MLRHLPSESAGWCSQRVRYRLQTGFSQEIQMSNSRRIIRSLAMAAICGGCCLTALAEDAKTAPMISMGGMKPAKSSDAAQPVITGDGKAEAMLTMDVRKYDFDGTKANNRMYMPEGTKLSAQKPEGITKEPKYNGTPKYATITLGNGTPSHFTIVSDEADGNEPKIYLD